MANMGYCRFQNTLNDLYDCQEALQEAPEGEDLSRDEARAALRLIETCRQIVQTAEDNDTEDALRKRYKKEDED